MVLPVSSVQIFKNIPTTNKIVSFQSSKASIDKKVKKLLAYDAKQEQPFFLEVKEGALQNILKKISDNKNSNFIISIAGESASGKTTVVKNMEDVIEKNRIPCTVMGADDYYRDASEKRKEAGSFAKLIESGYSFDEPRALNLPLLKSHLWELKNKIPIKTPQYDFATSSSTPNAKIKTPAHIILHEGLFALNNEFDGVSDIKIYVKTPFEVMKNRWFERTASRNTIGEEAEKQFNDVTSKAKTYIYPQEYKADIVLNGMSDIDYQKEIIEKLIDIVD